MVKLEIWGDTKIMDCHDLALLNSYNDKRKKALK